MTILKFAPRTFFTALAQVKLACSKDEMTPALGLISARAEGTSLHLCATDRYRAHYAHVALDEPVRPVDFTVPASAVADLKSMRWNAKRGGPLEAEAAIANDGVTFSATDCPEIRYPVPDTQEAALDAHYGVQSMLAKALLTLDHEGADRPSDMSFDPAFMADFQRAARLAPDSNVSVMAQNLDGRFICRLSDDSTSFRALVMSVRRSPEGGQDDAVLAGLDRVRELGKPSTGQVFSPAAPKDGPAASEAAERATHAPEPANA